MIQRDCIPCYSGPGWRLYCNDALAQLHNMETESVHCVMTSPPYWGLRDYGVAGQIGREDTVAEYIGKIVEVFAQVRRVLRSNGTLWLNLGDCYWSGNEKRDGGHDFLDGRRKLLQHKGTILSPKPAPDQGFKTKDLVGIPWLVAFELRANGWYLRSDIIWAKPNPMPESVTDRPTRAHEYLFLLTKTDRYYYDGDSIREPYSLGSIQRYDCKLQSTYPGSRQPGRSTEPRSKSNHFYAPNPRGRNKRSIWTITKQMFPEAHFATFPEELVTPCILAGCPEGDLVMDPFAGSGTVGVVALGLGRRFVGIELKDDYVMLAMKRLKATPWQTQIPV